MRPCEERWGEAGEGQGGDGEADGAGRQLLHVPDEERDGGSDRDPEQQGDPGPAPGAERQRHDDFSQPFMRLPGLAAEGVRERVGGQHMAKIEHPRPRRDVQEGVSVIEQTGGEGDEQADHQRDPRRRIQRERRRL